jgi:hypothetical protein
MHKSKKRTLSAGINSALNNISNHRQTPDKAPADPFVNKADEFTMLLLTSIVNRSLASFVADDSC